jgi:hypothetical protein
MTALKATNLRVECPDSPALPHHYRRRGGLRLVHPYHFDFVCNVKLRWHGMNIIDIFSKVRTSCVGREAVHALWPHTALETPA